MCLSACCAVLFQALREPDACALDKDSHSKGTSLHSVGEIRECQERREIKA